MAHHAGGPGVPQEEHLGPGVFPPDLAAGWSGAVPAAGATPTRDGGQSKWAEVAGGMGERKNGYVKRIHWKKIDLHVKRAFEQKQIEFYGRILIFQTTKEAKTNYEEVISIYLCFCV